LSYGRNGFLKRDERISRFVSNDDMEE